MRCISVPSFSTNRRVPSDSVISVAAHRSGGKDAFRALRYCEECHRNELSGWRCTGRIMGADVALRKRLRETHGRRRLSTRNQGSAQFSITQSGDQYFLELVCRSFGAATLWMARTKLPPFPRRYWRVESRRKGYGATRPVISLLVVPSDCLPLSAHQQDQLPVCISKRP